MVFKPRAGHVYKLRVTDNAGHSAILSTGTTDKATAADVERMVKMLRAQRKWPWLTLLATKRAKLAAAYDAHVAGRLGAFLDAALTESADTDLSPLVAEWAKRANAKYVRQVRRLIPAGERFPASTFRRKRISEFLAGLKCSGPTKNRYRAALSVFAKWLVEREVLESNPVRDVAMQKEHDPRMVWMTWDDAERVVAAMNSPWAELIAIMAATGIELGAALRLKRSDVDLDAQTIHARGSKTAWRNRVIRYEGWAHEEVRWLSTQTIGSGDLFPPIKHRRLLALFREAQKAVGLSGHRLHDLRHTYAVNALKKGYKPAVVAHQLGHKDATMVTKVYGRFVPDESDYRVTAAPQRTKGGSK